MAEDHSETGTLTKRRTMRRLPTFILALALIIPLAAQAAEDVPFPDLTVTGQLSQWDRAYLGVESDTVRIADIEAEFLLLEVFSMYCPICQRDAPRVNEVYEAIQDRGLGDRIKFVGVGTGNTPFEVTFFKDKYNVPFPLFHDQNYTAHKALGELGTPTFYVLRMGGDQPEVLLRKTGEAKDADWLLQTVLKTTGLQ